MMNAGNERWRSLTLEQVATLTPKAGRERLRALARLRQRERRARRNRIDYYPDELAAKVIQAAVERSEGDSVNAVINHIISRWVIAQRLDKVNETPLEPGKDAPSAETRPLRGGY